MMVLVALACASVEREAPADPPQPAPVAFASIKVELVSPPPTTCPADLSFVAHVTATNPRPEAANVAFFVEGSTPDGDRLIATRAHDGTALIFSVPPGGPHTRDFRFDRAGVIGGGYVTLRAYP